MALSAEAVERLFRVSVEGQDAVRALQQLANQAKKTDQAFDEFSKKITGLFKGALIEETIRRTVESLNAQIDALDQAGKATQKFGFTSVEEFSAIKFAVEASGGSMETLGAAAKALSVNMNKAVDPTSDMARILKKIGVDAAGTTTDALMRIADVFKAMPDGVKKTALAIELFGKAGQDMIPFLNQGASGIDALTEKAKELGIVMSGDLVKSATQFNDTMQEIAKQSEGTKNAFLTGVLPALNGIAQAFADMTKTGSGAELFGQAIGSILKVAATVAVQVIGLFRKIAAVVNALAVSIVAMVTGDFKLIPAILADMRAQLDAIEKSTAAAVNTIENYSQAERDAMDAENKRLARMQDYRNQVDINIEADKRAEEQRKKDVALAERLRSEFDKQVVAIEKLNQAQADTERLRKARIIDAQTEARILQAIADARSGAPTQDQVQKVLQLAGAVSAVNVKYADQEALIFKVAQALKLAPEVVQAALQAAQDEATGFDKIWKAFLSTLDDTNVKMQDFANIQARINQLQKEGADPQTIAMMQKKLDALKLGGDPVKDLEAFRSEFDKTAFAIEQVEAQMLRLNEMIARGDITDPELTRRLTEGMLKTKQVLIDSQRQITLLGLAIQELEQPLTDVLVNGFDNASEAVENFLKAVARMIIELTIVKPLIAGLVQQFGLTPAKASAPQSIAPIIVPDAASGLRAMTAPTQRMFAVGTSAPRGMSSLTLAAAMKKSTTTINITNNTPAQVTAQQNVTPGGSNVIDILIENKVNAAISAGRFDTSMRANYGMTRRGV